MSDLKTILYACDLASNSYPAFHMAVDLARVHCAKLIFLYVIEPLTEAQMSAVSIYYSLETMNELGARTITQVHQEVQNRIEEFYSKLHEERLPGGKPEPYVIEGVPATTIIKTAEMMDVDLIVMGSHSHHKLERLFIGSVANRVVSQASKPVLLVPIGSA